MSTPNVVTLAPPGKQQSDNPWHVKEYRAEEFKALLDAPRREVELYGLFSARKLAVHEAISNALHLPHDVMHRRQGLAAALYPAFTKRISVRDFTLRRTPQVHELSGALDLVAVVRSSGSS